MSASGETGWAFFKEGGDTLAVIIGGAGARLKLGLEVKLRLEIIGRRRQDRLFRQR